MDGSRAWRIEADYQPRHRGFAAAAFADQRKRGAALDREGNAIDGAQGQAWFVRERALQPGFRDIEVADNIDGLEDHFSHWRRASRRPGWRRRPSGPAAPP